MTGTGLSRGVTRVMSATVLEAAPRPGVAPRREPAPVPVPDRPRPGRHVLPLALAASALVHVLVLGVRFTVDRIDAPAAAPVRVLEVEAVPGMRVFDVVSVVADVPTPQVAVVQPQTLDPLPPPLEPPVETAVQPADAPQPAPAAGVNVPRSVAERIIPRSGDPRLWERQSDPMRPELEPLNNVRARVYASIRAYNDSVAAAAAAAARALDWSVRDGNGGRWGVSPGAIHLGSITLPLPFVFAQSAEQRALSREWAEIQQQAGRAQLEQSFEDRVRAIRARKDAARDSARRAGGR